MSGLIKRVTALTVFLLFAATVTWPDAAGADAPGPYAQHWAEQDVRFIEDAGHWTPPQEAQEVDYDAPLTAAEWNAMVSRLFGAVSGDDNVTGSLRRRLGKSNGRIRGFGGQPAS